MSRFLPRPLRRALSLFALTLVLGGCGVRVAQPPAPIPTPDVAEQQRQTIAVALERAILAAEAHEGSGDDFDRLSVILQGYLEEIGGVWLPPPRDDDPDPQSPAGENLPPTTAVAAQEAAARLADALPKVPEDQREAVVSMWLTLRTAEAALTNEPGPACDLPCGETMIPSALPESGKLAQVYDALGYLEQVRAARADGEERDRIAAGARALRLFAEEVAGDLSGAEQDTRAAAYPIDPDDLPGSATHYLEAAQREVLILAAASPDLLEPLWEISVLINPSHDLKPWPGLD